VSTTRALYPYLTRGFADGATSAQIGNALGISPTRVAQIERSALDRLRRCFAMIEEGCPVDDAIEICRGGTGGPRKRERTAPRAWSRVLSAEAKR